MPKRVALHFLEPIKVLPEDTALTLQKKTHDIMEAFIKKHQA